MPNTKITISQAEAWQIVEAIAVRASADGGAPVAIAIVDAAARLIAFTAMDNVVPASVKLSQSKAYSAVVGQKDTVHWASFPKNSTTVDFDMRNWTDENFSGFTGGVILLCNGQVIGGVGISGRKGQMAATDVVEQDNELARYENNFLIFKQI